MRRGACYAVNRNAREAVKLALLSGLSEPVGALLALTVLTPVLTESVLSMMMSFAAGMMTAVTLVDLWPSAVAYGKPWELYSGGAIGVVVLGVTSLVV